MTAMRFGASTFIWVSPFSNATLDLIDKVADFGFDLIEICVEDPATIDTAAISGRLRKAGIGATVCGAFGPDRDLSADDPATRENGLRYLARCVDIAADLGSPIVAGPMYSATGKTRLLSAPEREAQWRLSIDSMKRASDHASKKGVKLAVEPLNRFETDLLNTVAQAMDWLGRLGRDNVGLLLDTFHMNIEERNIPDAIRLGGDKVFHFHGCSNDRGTPGKDHIPWREIAAALRFIRYAGATVIEAFTPEIREIARAVSIWRPLAESQDALARDGLKFLKATLGN
jgi:D-psicose/D-tagatose/L-ribulose 3-epimerase